MQWIWEECKRNKYAQCCATCSGIDSEGTSLASPATHSKIAKVLCIKAGCMSSTGCYVLLKIVVTLVVVCMAIVCTKDEQ
jgi:hypothetical protein